MKVVTSVQLGESVGRHVVVADAQKPEDHEAVEARFLLGLPENPVTRRLAWLQRTGGDLYSGIKIHVPEYQETRVSRDICHDLLDDSQGHDA